MNESVQKDSKQGLVQCQKKDTSGPLPDKYNSEFVEAEWYEWWQSKGFFSPQYEGNRKTGRKFVMCLPPPNVTGTLHLGHALGNSIQDAIVRWHRMRGDETLWVPGCDHAGIATQVIVEKQILKDHGQTRHQIGRDQFIKEVWKWKNEKGDRIYEQMKRLGSSLDWERDNFTLNPKLSRSVREAFIRLHDEGLIYRSDRIVNWCCALKSSLSDIEVEDMKLSKKTMLSVPGYDKKISFGLLVHVKYPVINSDKMVTIATTRPETMLGDVAIAINPNDPRYLDLHGKQVCHPLTGQHLPIICDTFVDMEFGTGAVKLSPGHDMTDYTVGQKHDLPVINILTEDGTLTNVPQPFLGLARFSAREKVLEVLSDQQLLVAVEDHSMVLPVCSRSGDIIEPLLKEQWFVDCSDMAKSAIQAVKSGDLKLVPSQYEKQWDDWLENIRDWCISRQLWWGHQIPAYKASLKNSREELGWVSGHDMEEARSKAQRQFNISPEDLDQLQLVQDEDVLDTWFSSALLPFSVFGWPEQTQDLAEYYPTSLLETASDIMFFWVARMVMMGQKLTGKLPFDTVLFHSILRDAYERKMSKSLGNVIDPMDVIHGITLQALHERLKSSNLDTGEVLKARAAQIHQFPDGIPACGADALRFTLCSYNYKANYIDVDISRFNSSRQFCNKIWQTFRFINTNISSDFKPEPIKVDSLSPVDHWLRSRLSATVEICDLGFTNFELYKVTAGIKDFWWNDLCDVYLEYSKAIFASDDESMKQTVRQVLCETLRVSVIALAPFMPFLCEEIYQRLPVGDLHMESVCIAPYPLPSQYEWRDLVAEQDMNCARDIINDLLSIRRAHNITKTRADVYVECADSTVYSVVQKHELLIQTLSRSNQILFSEPPPGCIAHHGERCTLHMQLKDHINYGEEEKRITNEMNNLQKKLDKLMERNNKIHPNQALAAEQKMRDIREKLVKLEATMQTIKDAQRNINR